STTYQGSTFIGIDISPIFPTGIKPPNLTFYATNVLKGLPFPDNHFDFVYMRNLIIAFTEDEWNTVIGELIRVVKPGGWIELMEGNLEFEGEGACAQVLLGAFRSILRSNSMNPKICSQIYTFLSTSPLLKSFSFKEKLIPIGKWAGKIGEIASQDFCSLFLAVRGAICRVLEDERVIKGCSCGIKECHVGNEVFDKDGKNLCDHENRWNEEYAELVKEIAREYGLDEEDTAAGWTSVNIAEVGKIDSYNNQISQVSPIIEGKKPDNNIIGHVFIGFYSCWGDTKIGEPGPSSTFRRPIQHIGVPASPKAFLYSDQCRSLFSKNKWKLNSQPCYAAYHARIGDTEGIRWHVEHFGDWVLNAIQEVSSPRN
ncbi:691_t:CDS:2, partial [Gigaspora rosea]